jgi:hypothetical protein
VSLPRLAARRVPFSLRAVIAAYPSETITHHHTRGFTSIMPVQPARGG